MQQCIQIKVLAQMLGEQVQGFLDAGVEGDSAAVPGTNRIQEMMSEAICREQAMQVSAHDAAVA
jgi:hypothetical protein